MSDASSKSRPGKCTDLLSRCFPIGRPEQYSSADGELMWRPLFVSKKALTFRVFVISFSSSFSVFFRNVFGALITHDFIISYDKI